MSTNKQHYIIRVADGKNFINSVYPFWGVKRGAKNQIKTTLSKINIGDILWFLTSKKYGGQVIGMCEYTGLHDRADEPLISINTISDEEQGWKGNGDWTLQLNYNNLYDTEYQNIFICINCMSPILKYDTFKGSIKEDLYEHYKNFKKYSKPLLLRKLP